MSATIKLQALKPTYELKDAKKLCRVEKITVIR